MYCIHLTYFVQGLIVVHLIKLSMATLSFQQLTLAPPLPTHAMMGPPCRGIPAGPASKMANGPVVHPPAKVSVCNYRLQDKFKNFFQASDISFYTPFNTIGYNTLEYYVFSSCLLYNLYKFVHFYTVTAASDLMCGQLLSRILP